LAISPFSMPAAAVVAGLPYRRSSFRREGLSGGVIS
jgi:hypothetical protein